MAKDYADLITNQHNQRPKYRAMVEALSGAFGDVYDVLLSMPEKYDLDVAVGAQLDVIGQWVGQSRLIPNVILAEFFGFRDNPAALNFGEETNPAIGGRFYEEGEPFTGTSILDDEPYRLVIRARIVRNHSLGYTSDVLRAIEFIFGVPGIVDDPGNMTMRVYVSKPMNFVERAILKEIDILPRPSGVRISTYGYFYGDEYLGFDGQAGAVPFAEEGDVGPRGLLLEEF